MLKFLIIRLKQRVRMDLNCSYRKNIYEKVVYLKKMYEICDS